MSELIESIPTALFVVVALIVMFGIAIMFPVLFLIFQLIRQRIDPGLADRRGYEYKGFFEP